MADIAAGSIVKRPVVSQAAPATNALTHRVRHPRIVGLDVMKSAAMYFVVLIHYVFYTTAYPDGAMMRFVSVAYQYSVPLFFMVNGALLLTRPLNLGKHYRKLGRLVVVTVVWKALYALLFWLQHDDAPVTLKAFISFELGTDEIDGHPSGFFWFLNALIGLHLIVPLLKMAFDALDRRILWSVLWIVFGFAFVRCTLRIFLNFADAAYKTDLSSVLDNVARFYMFGFYGYVIVYFVAGGLLMEKFMKYRDPETGRFAWPFPRFGMMAAIACLVFCQVLLFVIQYFDSKFLDSGYQLDDSYQLIPGLLGTLLIFALFLMFRPSRRLSRVFTEIGSHTFGMYTTHVLLILVFLHVEERTGLSAALNSINPLLALVVSLVMIAILFALAWCVSWLGSRIPVVKKLFL